MWRRLQGALLYKSIEHRNEIDPDLRVGEEDLVPYAHLLNDPRRDVEEAKKIAA